jgi:hypothetical protein
MNVLESVQPIGQGNPEQVGAQQEESEPHYLLGPITFVSAWWRLESDAGQEFEQQVIAQASDGSELVLQPPSHFVMDRPFNRILHRIVMLVVPRTGIYHLHLQLRQVGTEQWQEMADYLLLVQEVPELAPEA